ncbi:substrate-binding domain-containing protein [Streptomyces aurantiogriseus]|nr:substrate-binding domain-containing protein [Streptomyces aurantiogriseus]
MTDTITLPDFTLNRREGFRLLVLLEDDGAGPSGKTPKITAGGRLRGGRIIRRAGPTRRRRAALISMVLAVALGVGGGVYVSNRSLALNATYSSGRLTVTGSTAFSPLAHEVKEAYEEQCAQAEVALDAVGSDQGLARLRQNPAAETIAMVDTVAGQEPEKGMDAHRVGVVVYAVVANRQLARDLGAGPSLWGRGLTQEQLARIFTGKKVEDADGRLADSTPVAVLREEGSGTRKVFESRVIGTEHGTPAYCALPAPGEAPNESTAQAAPRTCSVKSTTELLDCVNRTPNAIGYAEADALPFFPNVRTVPINTTPPTKEEVLDGDYGFWASEVLYTREDATGLTRNFLDFLRSRGISKLLEGQGFLPCRELRDAAVEGMRCGDA